MEQNPKRIKMSMKYWGSSSLPSSELVDRPAPAYVFARERVTAKYAKQQAGRISRKEKKKEFRLSLSQTQGDLRWLHITIQ